MGKFVHEGGITLAWVSFLLKQQAEGENIHGVMILLGARGKPNEKDTIAHYMFSGCRMCCP